VVLTLAACGPEPIRTSLPSTWRPSPNFNERRPNFIVIHHTGSSDAMSALATLSDPRKEVSAHYLIARDGRIFQLVDERSRAWHAGDSGWGPITDVNSASIGIELDNNGAEPFPDGQIAPLIALLTDIAAREHIPPTHVVGHADVAPGRKTDPSALFPWGTLAAAGFGLWCDPPYPPAPESFDLLLGLKAIGYDISDPDAALRAFRLHYRPRATSRPEAGSAGTNAGETDRGETDRGETDRGETAGDRDNTAGTATEEERALGQCLVGRASLGE
jgi:N-acetylmuramoyl-L-alanine amidase